METRLGMDMFASKLRVIPVLLVVILATGCGNGASGKSSQAPAPEGGPAAGESSNSTLPVHDKELPQHLRRSEVDVASNWERVVVRGWPSQPAFSLKLPLGWKFSPTQGIDFYVGKITGYGVELHFDYGAYSWTLNPAEGDPEHEYIVAYEEIGGVEAKLVAPKDSPDGFTGVYFRRLGGPRLVLYGRGLTAEQQETAFAVFRSVRTLASGHFEVEVSGLDAGDRAVLRLERREQDGSKLRVRRVEGVENGLWKEPTHLSDGRYSLVVEAPGYVNSPVAFDLRVPPGGVTWRYDFRFRLFHPEDAESVLGLPLCDPSKRPTGPMPTPQPPGVGGTPAGSCAALPTAMSVVPSIQGVVSGPEGLEGVVRVFELPPVEGECYAQLVGCPRLPDARAINELPDVTEEQLRLELPAGSGVWGYLGPKLPAGRRYLVVLQAPGYVIQPVGYVAPLAAGKIPHIVTNLDFSVTKATVTPPGSLVHGQAVSCSPQSTGVPCEAGVKVGKAYAYQLYTHCGIRSAYFNGQWWIADPVLEDNYNPPQGWGNPFDVGTMQLTEESRPLYRSAGGESAEFRAVAPDEEYQPYPCY